MSTRVNDITTKKQHRKDARIWWLHRLGWTQEEIGEVIGELRSDISMILPKTSELKKLAQDQSSRCHTPEKIGEAEDIPAELVAVLLLDGKSDQGLVVGGSKSEVFNQYLRRQATLSLLPYSHKGFSVA